MLKFIFNTIINFLGTFLAINRPPDNSKNKKKKFAVVHPYSQVNLNKKLLSSFNFHIFVFCLYEFFACFVSSFGARAFVFCFLFLFLFFEARPHYIALTGSNP